MLTTLLLSLTLAASPAASDCAAYEPVRKRLAEMQDAVARGADESTLEGPDLVGPLRTCFRTQVMPALTRAETDHRLIEAAVNDFFVWGRQPALLGLEDEFKPEFDQATVSIEKGVSHAYRVARDRCVRLNDQTQIHVMLGLARFAQLFSMTITGTLDSDLEACLRGSAYLVQAKLRSESTKRGVGSEYTYTALLRRVPNGDASEMAGTGSYGGYLVSHRANCSDRAQDTPQRFDVTGKLEATGSIVDMAAPGAAPDPHLMYVLASLDWPLRPMWGGDGPFATTREEREGIAGLGTIMSARPIKLTGRVTTWSNVSREDHDKCAGTITRSTSVRIVQLKGKR